MRNIFYAVVALVALGVPACTSDKHFEGSRPPNVTLPDVALVDDSGQPFAFSTLHGKGYALFFGYTHCPDTCPATLAKLERARVALPQTQRRKTTIVFVTVDPARDSPRQLHRYMALFGPGLIGVTGSPQALKMLYDRLGVWSVRLGRGPNYEMGHTSTIFFVDVDGRPRALHDLQDPVASLSHDFRELTP